MRSEAITAGHGAPKGPTPEASEGLGGAGAGIFESQSWSQQQLGVSRWLLARRGGVEGHAGGNPYGIQVRKWKAWAAKAMPTIRHKASVPVCEARSRYQARPAPDSMAAMNAARANEFPLHDMMGLGLDGGQRRPPGQQANLEKPRPARQRQ